MTDPPQLILNFLPLRFILYLLYRVVRAIVEAESDLVAWVKKCATNQENDVEFLSIIMRFRFDRSDCTRFCDFLTFTESNGCFDEIVHPEWMIYTITEKYVYLVKVPDTECTIDKYARLADFLHGCAEKVARVRIDTFVEQTLHFPSFASRVVFLHSVPRSGGTVAARMLQACDPTYRNLEVFGEPPVITSLSLLADILPIETMRRLTLSALRFALFHQQNDQTIVYKTRMNSARCIPYVHSSCPEVQHCLITSKDLKSCTARMLNEEHEEAPIFRIVSKMLNENRWLCELMSQWPKIQDKTTRLVGPQTSFEFATSLVLGSALAYTRCMPYFSIEPVFFEDLMAETVRCLAPLLDICELSDLAIPDAIDWKRNTEGEWKAEWELCSLNEEQCTRVDHLYELLQGDWDI